MDTLSIARVPWRVDQLGVFVPACRSHSFRILTLALACAVFALATVLVPRAVAEPAATIEQKKAEQTALAQQMEQTRIDLAVQVNEYVELGKEIEQTKQEISEVSTELATTEVRLSQAQVELEQRVVELYRGDREDLLGMVFTAHSIQDLWVRSNYLTRITRRDVQLISEVRLARSENLWLQEGLYSKADRLITIQAEAAERQKQIERDLVEQQKRADQLRVDIAQLMWAPVQAGSEPQGTFTPATVLSDANFRAAQSMTAEQIQAFLNDQPGTLKSYKTSDHAGKMKTAAQIVSEAATAFNISPKVLLVKLQKEQSLIEGRSPAQRAYDWAMGCGCPDDGSRAAQYQGFGNQVWFAAEKLSSYGTKYKWTPGKTMNIDGSAITPTNVATFSLYTYTPHFKGNMSFWLLYWRYFGDPLSV